MIIAAMILVLIVFVLSFFVSVEVTVKWDDEE